MQPTVLDLFAGCGGLGLGFTKAGFKVRAAIEIDDWACQTYAANHPEVKVVCADITKMSDEEILLVAPERIDLIVGGPPCQGFSHANIVRRDPKDPRNSLFKEYLRCVKLFNPTAFLIENVPGLLKSKTADNEKVIDVIVNEIQKLGYQCDYRVLNAVNYGVPQRRERLIIFAAKNESEIDVKTVWPSPTHSLVCSMGLKKAITCWEAISDLPQVIEPSGLHSYKYECPPKNSYQRELRKGSALIYNHEPMRHSQRIVERFKLMQVGMKMSALDKIHLPRKRGNPLEISDKEPYDQNNRRQDPDRPCSTVPASFYANFIHPFLHRNFTAREGARIQSFPDTFVFKGKKTIPSKSLLRKEGRLDEIHLCQYEQIGNAVPPLLAEAIARNILPLYQSISINGAIFNSWKESSAKRTERIEVLR